MRGTFQIRLITFLTLAWNLLPLDWTHAKTSTNCRPTLVRLTNQLPIKKSWPIAKFHQEQNSPKSCSLFTATQIVNAARETINQKPLTPDEILELSNSPTWKKNIQSFAEGLTLQELAQELGSVFKNSEGLKARIRVVHGDHEDFNELFLDDLFKTHEKPKTRFLVLNYFLENITKDTRDRHGHFSPIGMYYGKAHSVMILDTAREKSDLYTTPVDKIIEAMKTNDSESGRMRGFISIEIL